MFRDSLVLERGPRRRGGAKNKNRKTKANGRRKSWNEGVSSLVCSNLIHGAPEHHRRGRVSGATC